MDTNIGLSVLIAAKDEELSIAEVVQSHFSILQASQYPINWDIGVLDDGSSDSTFTVLTELQKQFPELKIWHNDNPSGIANAFKQLAENAQHEWIYWALERADSEHTAAFAHLFLGCSWS